MILNELFERRYKFDPTRAKQIRTALGLTQEQLAERLRIGSRNEIGHLERGAMLLQNRVPRKGTNARKYLEFLRDEGDYNPYQI